MKTMSDGSKVVGLFNRQTTTERMSVSLSRIGIQKQASVRDVWLKQDRGTFEGSFSAFVPGHGVVLVRIREK